jgi:hypothetical protein
VSCVETTKIFVNEEEAKAHWGAIAPTEKSTDIILIKIIWVQHEKMFSKIHFQ